MLKIGFIGTGNFARQHAEILTKLGVDIVGCYGTNPKKTEHFATEFKCRIFADPNKLITKDLIDALFIVIPPFAHNGIYENLSIQNGIPFFCEKPGGLSEKISAEINEKAKKSNLLTSCGYLLRYESLFEQIIEIINRNRISTLRICSYSYMPEVHWWRKSKLSGGMMVEGGCHYVDLLRFLFGEIDSVAALSTTGIANNKVLNADIYDSMEAIFKFNSGIIGSIGITHLLNKINARKDLLEMYGDDFALKIDLYKLRYMNEAVARYKEAGMKDWIRISNVTSKQSLLTKQSTSFINAIVQKNPNLIRSPYHDACKTLKVVLAMNDSAAKYSFKTT